MRKEKRTMDTHKKLVCCFKDEPYGIKTASLVSGERRESKETHSVFKSEIARSNCMLTLSADICVSKLAVPI